MNLPPVIVVTLAEEPWKRPVAEQHLESLGIYAQFIEGIQGMTIGLRATNPYDYDPLTSTPKYIHSSQMGCVLTHRMALSSALSQEHIEFIVMEDDVLLDDDFVQKFCEWREMVPEDAEVGQLQYIHGEDKPKQEVNELVSRIAYPFCSSCIWWTAQGALKAIPLMRPVDQPYDTLLAMRVYPFLRHYVPTDPFVTQRTIKNQWPSAVGDAPKLVT